MEKEINKRTAPPAAETAVTVKYFEPDSDSSENSNIELVKKYFVKPQPKSLNHDALAEHRNLDKRKMWLEKKFNQRKENAPKNLTETALKEKKGIEKRLEESDIALSQLIQFGGELVTNVKLANEKREILRRNFETAKRGELLNDLENESILALNRFDEITSKWSELKTIKEPMSLYEELEVQKQRIADLMKQKDAIIKECRDEIDRVDERYYVDQHRQAADIYSLVERVDNQIELIKFTYNKHLELLQQTIEEERKNLSLAASRKWQGLFDKQAENERTRLAIIKQKEEFYENEITRISKEQEDITRSTRIRLENDAEILQLELRTIKNDVITNSEKLDYNYQVLQKRNEENLIVSNQQKHRFNRITETISTLKKKIRETKINSEIQIKKLTSEVLSLHGRITDLEAKAEQFKLNNEQKFNTVWDINYRESMDLLNKILDIDRVLYEQQLGLEWQRPEVPSNKKKDLTRIKKILPSSNKSIKSKSTVGSPTLSITSSARKETQKGAVVVMAKNSDNRLLRNVIRKISDRASFLLDEKLINILGQYDESEKTLVRIDNIFNALRIEDIDDVNSLIEYFKPYSYCPHCSAGFQTKELDKLHNVEFENNEELKTSLSGSSLDSDGIFQLPDAMASPTLSKEELLSVMSYETDELDKNLVTLIGQREEDVFITNTFADQPKSVKFDESSRKSASKSMCSNHYYVIEPALVLTALREYVEKKLEKRYSVNINQLKSVHSVAISRRDRDSSIALSVPKVDVKSYWSQFLLAFPESKQKLWKSLEHGLNHYYATLRNREKLDQECEFLRRQNAELKFLLQKYLTKPNKR